MFAMNLPYIDENINFAPSYDSKSHKIYFQQLAGNVGRWQLLKYLFNNKFFRMLLNLDNSASHMKCSKILSNEVDSFRFESVGGLKGYYSIDGEVIINYYFK
jgi:hypothetical protein